MVIYYIIMALANQGGTMFRERITPRKIIIGGAVALGLGGISFGFLRPSEIGLWCPSSMLYLLVIAGPAIYFWENDGKGKPPSGFTDNQPGDN